MSFKIAITIRSDTRYLSSLRQLISAASGVVGEDRFPRRAQEAVSLALIEAVDNAIFHAHKKRINMPIDIVLHVNERYIQIDVGDKSEGFSLNQMEAPDSLSTHGRGLFIIMSMMNKIDSVVENGTHWMKMTYYL